MHIENRAIGAGVCECRLRVKGKQVEDLRDLVTVSGEHWIMRMPEGHGSHWFLETGKAILCVGSCEPGKPAGCWYRSIPDHEDLIVPYDLYKDFLRLFSLSIIRGMSRYSKIDCVSKIWLCTIPF